ncbi:sigma-70 family RNA polymerase sigma factor [Fredinandcohnia humi]
METKLINGEYKTRDQVVIENIGLVEKVANRYEQAGKPSGFEFEDLCSIGTIGLIKAFYVFDGSAGNQFSTYAYSKIRGEITIALANGHDRGVRYPKNIKEKAVTIKRRNLQDESIEIIAEALEISEQMAKTALEYLNLGKALSLDETVKSIKQQEERTYHEHIGANQDYSMVVVKDFLNRLRPREKELTIALMNGLSSTDVARRWGVSKTVPYNHLKRIRPKLQAYIGEGAIAVVK